MTNKHLEIKSNSRCKICEPEEYYKGKFCIKCINDHICDSCWKNTSNALAYMRDLTGDPGWGDRDKDNTVSTEGHASVLNAFFAGQGISFYCVPVGSNFEIRKRIHWMR